MIQTEKEKIEKLRLFFTKLKAVLSRTCDVLKMKNIINKKISRNKSFTRRKPMYKGPTINDGGNFYKVLTPTSSMSTASFF